MTAAYGRIANGGAESVEITSFESEDFANVSLHVTTIENGVSKMKSAPKITLAPGASAVLEPGGLHLMLMQPTRKVRPGDSIGVTLVTAGGERFAFKLPVEAR